MSRATASGRMIQDWIEGHRGVSPFFAPANKKNMVRHAQKIQKGPERFAVPVLDFLIYPLKTKSILCGVTEYHENENENYCNAAACCRSYRMFQ